MEDIRIIDLYWARSEEAIHESAKKYGPYCHTIAWNILQDQQDSEECVNDTWLQAWNAMPPKKPNLLGAFLGKITRNLALDKYRFYHTQKRGGGQAWLALEELKDCVPHPASTEQVVDDLALTEVLNKFLTGLKPEARKLFLRRYWYASSINAIARDYGLTASKVKMSLHRTREKLKAHLEQEGITL